MRSRAPSPIVAIGWHSLRGSRGQQRPRDEPSCMGTVADEGNRTHVEAEPRRANSTAENNSEHASHLRCISGIPWVNKDISIEISGCVVVKYWSWKKPWGEHQSNFFCCLVRTWRSRKTNSPLKLAHARARAGARIS